MTNNRSVLLISAIALILLALVPAVSAVEVIYDRELYEFVNTSASGTQISTDAKYPATEYLNDIVFKDITKAQTLEFLVYEVSGKQGGWNNHTWINEGRHDFTYTFNGKERPGVLYLNRKTDSTGSVTSTQYTIYLKDWDIGDLTGKQSIKMPFYLYSGSSPLGGVSTPTNTYICRRIGSDLRVPPPSVEVKITEKTGITWKHYLLVTQDVDSYHIYINGYIDGHKYTSEVGFKKAGEIFSKFTNLGEAIRRSVLKSEIDLIEITSPSGAEYAYPLYEGIPPKTRTVTVTMTDTDGNKISGFDVKAVNLYTGIEYTTSTDTDVAYITLPLDRIATVPNPETGEYQEAPVGTYIFYGYKPGYKMDPGYGIMVNVLPERYIPDIFCDIIVTTLSGNLRTGTVTVTDHNGTTIRGFEVKAVNYYTGEEYTVSTDTDVAIITLPMDRTTSWPNPQTGQYEDVPVGYYTFFVYKPGYKMISEDGVRISVLPEQYQGSYQLCNIIVTSEDGYLTGKHKFQLRSLADNSILQTGTVSAKSATTGEWYNGTVVNGLATLILPYDTSDAISEYAGKYYIYGSSPGYLDSEYPAQVIVRPDNQDQIWGIYLTPIGGVPEPGYVKLRIQAITETGQGIPNADVFIKGVDGPGWELSEIYTTSSNGYAEISVPENTTYDISVSAVGYTSSSRRVEVTTEDPPLMYFTLYLSGWVTPIPTTQPTAQPTGWPPTQPTPTSGVPGDDGSEGFLSEAIRGISRAFGVGFATGKTIFGMLLAIAIGFATAKQLRGGAAEFGLGLLGGTMLGVLVGLLPVWTIVVLLLVVGMYIGYRYVGGGSNG